MVDDSDKGNTYGNRYVLELAKAGDWEALADYIERGGPITPSMRSFLVEVLRGLRRRKQRPKKAATKTRTREIGGYVELQRRDGVKDPIKRAMEAFGVSRRSVQTAANDFEKLDQEAKDFVLAAKDGWVFIKRGANK
jgi:hypothetical protein